MEFQNANNADEQGNNGDKLFKNCYCGCGLTFIEGDSLGFYMEVADGDEGSFLREDKIDGDDWHNYIKTNLIQTWGDFIRLIEYNHYEDPNNRVWFHLYPYIRDRDLMNDDTQIQYDYIN